MQDKLEGLVQGIQQWAEDRNIVNGSRTIDQAMKLFAEFGELCDHVGDNEISKIPDDIGDVFVVLTIMCKQMDYNILEAFGYEYTTYDTKTAVKYLAERLSSFVYEASNYIVSDELSDAIGYLAFIASTNGFDFVNCVEEAYNDIKDRKGVLFNGVFIKESNPAYKEALEKLGKA